MAANRRKFLGALGWLAGISGSHVLLNFDWEGFKNNRLPKNKRKLIVGYVPVT